MLRDVRKRFGLIRVLQDSHEYEQRGSSFFATPADYLRQRFNFFTA
jgi:hypothetical protein